MAFTKKKKYDYMRPICQLRINQHPAELGLKGFGGRIVALASLTRSWNVLYLESTGTRSTPGELP